MIISFDKAKRSRLSKKSDSKSKTKKIEDSFEARSQAAFSSWTWKCDKCETPDSIFTASQEDSSKNIYREDSEQLICLGCFHKEGIAWTKQQTTQGSQGPYQAPNYNDPFAMVWKRYIEDNTTYLLSHPDLLSHPENEWCSTVVIIVPKPYIEAYGIPQFWESYGDNFVPGYVQLLWKGEKDE